MMPILASGVLGLIIGGYIGVDWGGQGRYESGLAEGKRVQKESDEKDRRLESETTLRQRGEQNVRQTLQNNAASETARIAAAATVAGIAIRSTRMLDGVRVVQPPRAADGRIRLPTAASPAPGGTGLSGNPARLFPDAYRETVDDGALAERAVAVLAVCTAAFPTTVSHP